MTGGQEILMHDIKAIREDAGEFVRGLQRRGVADAQAIAGALLEKDKALRDLLVRLQGEQARRNDASKLIGQAKQKKDEAQAKALMVEVAVRFHLPWPMPPAIHHADDVLALT